MRTTQALGQLAQQIHVQALVMTYSDCFWILGVGLIALMPMMLILRRPAPPSGAATQAAARQAMEAAH